MSPHEKSNLRPSDSVLRCSTTEPQRLHSERGVPVAQWLEHRIRRSKVQFLPSPSLRKSDIICHSIIFISSQVAPEILNQPSVNITRQTMEGNKYFVFSCTIVGNPPPLVYWTRNGLTLNVTTNPRLSAVSWNSIYSLNIINVSRSDAGQYRCMAINSVGISRSLGETLKVLCEYFHI